MIRPYPPARKPKRLSPTAPDATASKGIGHGDWREMLTAKRTVVAAHDARTIQGDHPRRLSGIMMILDMTVHI